MEHLWRSRAGRTSQQVLHEYYVTVTRKLRPGLPAATARSDVRALLQWNPVVANAALLEHAWAIEDRFGLSFWDSLIVAAAAASKAAILLTADLQEGAEMDGILVVNPFRTAPVNSDTVHDR